MGSNRKRTFIGNVFLTSGAEAISLASNVVVISLVGWWLGPVALAEYLLLRRVSIWLQSGSRVGVSTALPRYVAQTVGSESRSRDSGAYFAGGMAVVMLLTVGLAAVLLAGRAEFAAWIFGNGKLGELVLALALMLVGLGTYSVVYCYYLGLLDMIRANLLGVCMAIIPVGAVLALGKSHSIAFIAGAIGVLTMIVSVLFSIPILRQPGFFPLSGVRARTRELLRYGVPRVPGDFGNYALLAIGPVVAAHYVPMARVSSLLLGMTVLAVVSYGTLPVRTVLLSHVSMRLEKGGVDSIRGGLQTLVAAVPEISIFLCVQLFIFADVIVRYWVGPNFLNQVDVIRLLILAIPPYMFFTLLRSSIDAATIKAHNTANVLIGLAIYIALLGLTVVSLPAHWVPEGVAGSLLAAIGALGILTARTFCRLYGARIPWRRLIPSMVAAGLLGGVSLLYRSLQGAWVRPTPVIGLELLLGASYLGILGLFGSGWVRYSWRMALREIHAITT
jgi:O-antigen/teichoic acid export membrane protein